MSPYRAYYCEAHDAYHVERFRQQVTCDGPLVHCGDEDAIAQCPICQSEYYRDLAQMEAKDARAGA